jgi:hypothetical protein
MYTLFSLIFKIKVNILRNRTFVLVQCVLPLNLNKYMLCKWLCGIKEETKPFRRCVFCAIKWKSPIAKAHFHLHILKTSKWFPISIQKSNVFIFDNMVVMCSFKINSRLVTLWINVREHRWGNQKWTIKRNW